MIISPTWATALKFNNTLVVFFSFGNDDDTGLCLAQVSTVYAMQ